MKLSVIDLGTNTFKLLIARIQGSGFTVERVEKQGVKLGAGSYRNREISFHDMERAVNVLNDFQRIIHEESAAKPLALATAVVRDSLNGEDFLDYIREHTGINIQTIDSNREAELIATGVFSALDHKNRDVMVMDIGGGSTEFIRIKAGKTLWHKSFPVGAYRLMQELQPGDPVTEQGVTELYNYFDNYLGELKDHFQPGVTELLGCSGSFETFADVIALEIEGRQNTPAVSSLCLENDLLDDLFQKLQTYNRRQRLKMKGLPEYRVNTIIFGALAVQWFREKFRPVKILVSYRSMKEGVINEIINERI